MQAAPPLLLSVFSSFTMGGAQSRFITLANHFGPAFRHAIIAMDGKLDARSRLESGLEPHFPAVEIRKGDTLGNVRRFRRLLRALRPDVLVTYNWGTIEWALANVLPLVRHIHIEDGFGPEERDIQLPRRVLARRLLLRRSTVVLPSRTLLAIATGIWKLNPRRLRYIPNGIDLDGFGAPPAARLDPTPVIGTVAALRPEKNLARLLRAFRIASERHPARLVVAGDGPERPALAALAAELGIAGRVEFTGYIARPQSLYGGFDIVALSSDTEQMPMAVLEGMAARLPVAATDVGDIRAMLAAPNAPFLVPRDDAALAGALATLLGDAALRRSLGEANRAKAERDYAQATMFAAYDALFRGTAG